ncbi:hypothetical protein N0V95_005071 [Ascochyta clinopodiicola]|nr:hypothetical protein N0V95_005071 [Ascochyta clinopodiicola]
MQRHLGHHHEQLALFALPANLDDIEDDLDEEDQDSVVKAEEDREGEGEDLTDTSDTSEIEELIQRNDDLHEDPVTIFSDQHGEFQYHTASGYHGLEGQRTYNSNESVQDFDDDEDEDNDDDSPGPFEKSRQVHLARGNHAKNQAKAQEESDHQAFQKSPVNNEDTAEELKEAAEEVSDDSVVGNAPTSVSETAQATRDDVEREMEKAQRWSRAEWEVRKRVQEVADIEQDPFIREFMLGVDERITEEAPVKREERVAQQAAVDAYNQKKAQGEKKAAEERDRIIYEYERKKFSDAEEAKKVREELLLHLELEDRKQRQKGKEEYEVFLSKQKEKEDAAMERRLAEDRDLDEAMRKRLKEFGFEEDQIQNMVQPEQTKTGGKGKAAISTNDLPSTVPQPTYIKIHKDHLDIETLQYYDIPYEFDKDPDYIIVLREIDEREVDVLLEHTRRLRRAMKRTLIDAERSGNRTSEESDFEVQRNESQQPQKPRMPSVSEVDRQQPYEPWDLNLSNDHSEPEIAVNMSPVDGSLNPFTAERAAKIPLYNVNSDDENEENNALERSSAADNQSRDIGEIPITETNWAREDSKARDSRGTSSKGSHARTEYPTPRYTKGDYVHMAFFENGSRMKGVFTIRGAKCNDVGKWEYSLVDCFTGRLYKNGAAVRERDLKPGT